MNSYIIKLDKKETESLIKEIESHDHCSEINELLGYEELIDFTDELLQQNIKYVELLKRIEILQVS